MRAHLPLLLATILGGAAAFALRLAQTRTGFEPDTGLPVPGNVPAILLVILLVLLAAGLFLLCRRIPKERHPVSFLPCFSTADAAFLIVPLCGVFLLGAS